MAKSREACIWCLCSGMQYNIYHPGNCHNCELQFCSESCFCSMQGKQVEKDFDIKRAAGGQSNRAVQRQYTAQVSQNYLEVHLFWAGKGTCCVPKHGTYGPSISTISATPSEQNFFIFFPLTILCSWCCVMTVELWIWCRFCAYCK